jgi:biopolymer transport protein TolQ
MTLLRGAPEAASAGDAPMIKLDLIGLLAHAAWPVKITLGLLIVCSLLVWIIAVLKLLQLGRLRVSEGDFERRAHKAASARELYEIAGARGSAPGARVVGELFKRGPTAPVDRLRAVADRAIVTEGQSARALMWFLAFIASAAPFIGLFGTVWGIMRSFEGIAAANSTSLAVVAPGIAEALFATAMGLAAAIPAVVAYNKFTVEIGRFSGTMHGLIGRSSGLLSRAAVEAD